MKWCWEGCECKKKMYLKIHWDICFCTARLERVSPSEPEAENHPGWFLSRRSTIRNTINEYHKQSRQDCHPSDFGLNQTFSHWCSRLITIKTVIKTNAGGRPQQWRCDWLLRVPHPRQGLVSDLFLFRWVNSYEMLFLGKAFRTGIKEEKSLQAIVKGYYSSLFCRPPKTISYSNSQYRYTHTNPFGYLSSLKGLSFPVLSCLF